jgi:hypothetical protein
METEIVDDSSSKRSSLDDVAKTRTAGLGSVIGQRHMLKFAARARARVTTCDDRRTIYSSTGHLRLQSTFSICLSQSYPLRSPPEPP